MPRATWEDTQFGVELLPGQPAGLRAPGTIDLASRPVVRNPDGSVSTVLSMSVGMPEGEVLLPMVGQKGEVYTPEQAIEAYKTSGYHLGIFNDVSNADNYAETLHANQANEYVPQDSPGFLDTMAAALRFSNTATNAFELFTRDNVPVAQANYSAYKIEGELTGYDEDEATRNRFLLSRSPEETQQIKSRIDEERAAMAVLAGAGGGGLAATLASTTLMDPITLASMLMPLTGPEALGAAATRTTKVLRGVAAQVALDTAAETIMHSNQEMRTLGQSLENVAMSAIFTGALGTLATRVPKAEFERLRTKAERELRQLDIETRAPTSSTAGAAQVGHGTSLEDEGLAAGAATIAATVGKVSPLTRLLQSPTKTARVLAQMVGDIPYILGKNLRGIATGQGVEARSSVRIRRAYADTVLSMTNKFDEYLQTKPATALNWDEFKDAVSATMRTGDTHAVAQVQDVARSMRKIFDQHRAELIALKVLPEDLHLVGAKSYFPRVYNHHAIRANRMQFEDVLRKWFRENPVPTKVLRQVTKEGGETAEEMVEKMVPRSAPEVEAAVQDTIDNVLGTNGAGASLGRGSGHPNALKSRELDVPDELLQPYLINDAEAVMNSYLHTMIPQIEMRKQFGDIGIEPELQKLRDEYHILISNTKNNALKKELEARMAADQEDLRAVHARVLGHTRGNAGPEALVRWSRIIRNANYPRALGGMLLSSFSDYGHVMTRYGMAKTLGATIKFLANSEVRKLSRVQANKIGAAMDLFRDTRAQTLGEISADVPTGGRIDTGLHRLSAKFTKLTGMSHWNTGIKFLAMALEQDAMINAIKKGDSIPKFAKAKMAQMGLDDDVLRRIAGESEHFVNDGGIWRMRTELWADKDAARIVETALIRAGDIMTIVRGAGDTPLVMDNPIVKMLLQFKGFGIASVNRIMIPVAQGIAHGDMATITGASFMLALGGLTYATKEIVAGREPDLSPEVVSMQMLNWSGLLGYIPDMWDPLIGGVFGTPRFSKFSDQQPIETLLGPTLGFATDVYNVIKNDKNEWGVTQKDIHAFRKILPMQNLFYLRRILDGLEGEVAQNVFGASDAGNKTFMQRSFGPLEAAPETETDLGSVAAGIGMAAIAIALGGKAAKSIRTLGGELPPPKGSVAEGAQMGTHALGISAQAVSRPELVRYYEDVANLIYSKLQTVEGFDKLTAAPIADMVKALDKIVTSESPYRPLVDKLLKADMPGKVIFGNTDHMKYLFRGNTNKSVAEGRAAGVYTTGEINWVDGKDHIFINMDEAVGPNVGHVLVHELTHAATVRKISDNDTVQRDLLKLKDRVFGTTPDKVSSGSYGNTDVLEFVAEAWSNLELQRAMKQTGTWNDFVKTIGSIFGIAGVGLAALETAMTAPEQSQPTA